MTDGSPVARRSSDFVAMDLGIRAAKAICDRFGAQVVDYSAEGARGSITLHIPSRRERFAMSAARYEAALSAASQVLQRTSDVMERAEHHRSTNRALRTSLAEHRRALSAARAESRRIIEALPDRTAERPGPH
jgi:hypothetical protein